VGDDRQLKVFDLGSLGPRPTPPGWPRYDRSIWALAVSDDGRLLAVGATDHVFPWDAVKATPLASKGFRTIGTRQIALSPRGDLLAAIAGEGLRVYAVPDGREVERLDVPHNARILFAPDGRLVVTNVTNIELHGPAFGKKGAAGR
jgi:hypothetical protein